MDLTHKVRRLEADLIVAQNRVAVLTQQFEELADRVAQLRQLAEQRPAMPLIAGARAVGLVEHGRQTIHK